MDLLKTSFQNKKVFITGHTGFKGAWLTYWLHSIGAKVRGYALVAGERSLYRAINGNAYCESMEADVRDSKTLTKAIRDFQPDYIFHLAAQSLVRESYRDALYTYSVNAMGTANLLEALKGMNKPCAVVVVTTDKVYANLERMEPYGEGDRLGGYDPYSASKACSELIAYSYRSSFFNMKEYESHQIAIATARAGNVIGGGDWSDDRLIPDIVRGLEKKECIVLRYPEAVRPWQHVLEPLYGYMLLAKRLAEQPYEFSTAWNFGPEISDNLTVEEVVQKALQVWGSGEYRVEPTGDNFHEAGLLRLDISKAKTKLEWTPIFNAEQSIGRTISWYRDYLESPEAAAQLVARDIEAFNHSAIAV